MLRPLAFANGTFLVPDPPVVAPVPRPPLLSWISDPHLALLLPVVAYWTYGLFFHYLDTHNYFVRHRLHTPEELLKRNRCSLADVVKAVLIQHFIQTSVGLVVNYMEPPELAGFEPLHLWRIQHFFPLAAGIGPKQHHAFTLLGPLVKLLSLSSYRIAAPVAWLVYYLAIPFTKIFLAFLIIDSWQYTLHRYMHQNKFLYRHLHSVHHRLYVPYAFGALYNSLLEGFLLDTLGTGVAHIAVGLSARESIVLYTFSTLKTVDDHCGYQLPYDPFQKLFPNNAAYHDIHHQHFGIKTNFAQPFFTFWDTMCGTRYPLLEKYEAEQKRLREENYRLYLQNKAKSE